MSAIKKANLIKTTIEKAAVSCKTFDTKTSSKQLDGNNATALVFGGLGMSERHISKHSSLYGKYLELVLVWS